MLPWKVNICTAKVTISSSLFVDRTAKIKHLDDTSRTKVKILTNDLNKLGLRKLTSSESIHTDRCRMCNTDRIGKLDLTLVSKTCCNNILSNVTSCISCRTVYLCAVLTGESTAAVTSCSTVGINDDLTSCQATVTVRSTISAGMIASKTYFLMSSWICS